MLHVLHVGVGMPGPGAQQLMGMVRAAHGVLWKATVCVLGPGHELAAEGIPVVELDAGSKAGRLAMLRRLVRSGGFDVVHSSQSAANVVARLAAAAPRPPAVVVSERRTCDLRSGPARLLDRALRPLADAYVANSHEVAAFVQRTHAVDPDRVAVVGNGIDRSVFTPQPRRKRREDAPLRIGGLGALVPQTGFDTAIAALPRVMAGPSGAELVLAGVGPERDWLAFMAGALPVRFAGFLPSPSEVATFLRSLDVAVLPARYEALPNAVLEARACGLPVVASNVPGLADVVDDGVILVPPDDHRYLADALLGVAECPPKGWPAPSIPSFADVADGHLAVFERALAHRQRGRSWTLSSQASPDSSAATSPRHSSRKDTASSGSTASRRTTDSRSSART